MLPQINLALGAGTTALLVLLAALLLRDFGAVAAGRLAAVFALGSAVHASIASYGFTPPVTPWQAGLIAISTGNVVVFWLFARALFDDTFEVRGWHVLPWAAVVTLSLIDCLVLVPAQTLDPQISGVVMSAVALSFVALAVGQTVASWSTDLVEDRRRFRVFVVVATAIYAGFNAVVQLLTSGHGAPGIVATANAAILAAVVIAIFYSLTRVRGETLFPAIALPRNAATASIESSGTDRKLLDALMRLMADDRIYRHEGVTIGTLATKLAVPEYKLRRLINRELGYRNFNVFLNNHRIEEAKAALADPTQAGVPVITIAMDAGFQSLGPFNRAFKATTGVTPTEYRRLNEARA
ncbi:MAG: AraC family transcriptional regulator [Bradyrhizobium sp.]|uniref:AraC family transcriptional regulator n=1 Tax=Bradyrhizobium sp. TaxID=376 RepID=UPI0011FEA91D|nr:helix-turn-helix domain-containing protein [Bradyrhizobium sp.]THD65558.1 MAG: AraC family transcriptional regulator [Bradyrhizobium sp.]